MRKFFFVTILVSTCVLGFLYSSPPTIAQTTKQTTVQTIPPTLPTPLPTPIILPGRDGCAYAPTNKGDGLWAFEATFDGDPSAPSQTLLPCNFDFVATHRTHPSESFQSFEAFPADHGADCAGPNPYSDPLPQHSVTTSHFNGSRQPDPSFFICKNHMMSSMGHVAGYSVTSFWPKQDFDFTNGGVLEFDVNINDAHPRVWFEVMITPREELHVGAAKDYLPIEETYPDDRIVLMFDESKRKIQVGRDAAPPDGIMVDAVEDYPWAARHPTDVANADRRIRRKMRVVLANEKIIWSIQQANGRFDSYTVDVPGGLPFSRGLVVFKTHSYTPDKAGNVNAYTFHWDNIRFSGPVTGQYEAYEAKDVVYLQANGARTIGEQASDTITLPDKPEQMGNNPVLFGQLHGAMRGQVQLSINGRPFIDVDPTRYAKDDCSSEDWHSFHLPLDPSILKPGDNTFAWRIGPRPSCAGDYPWDGYSVKGLEIQMDGRPAVPPSMPPAGPDAPAREGPHALSGRVYVDNNSSGLFDEGDKPLPGLLVQILDLQTDEVALQLMTDAEGLYHFEELAPGVYTVNFVMPPFYLPNGASDFAVRLGAADVSLPDFGVVALGNRVFAPVVCQP